MEKEAQALAKRFRDLEVSQAKVREQLNVILRGGAVAPGNRPWQAITGGGQAGPLPGFFAGSPYRNVLDCMGHALHVCRPGTGEIIYWNQSAVKLYGWKDVEAVGQRVADLLLDEESRPHLEKAMERLNKGESWSGRFPFRKRSGEMFTALVTQSPLVEDGEYIGIITVSSDAVILDDKYSEKSRENWERVQGGKPCKPSCPRVQWRPQQQIASSVSTLVLLM